MKNGPAVSSPTRICLKPRGGERPNSSQYSGRLGLKILNKAVVLGLMLSLTTWAWAGFGDPYVGELSDSWATTSAVIATVSSKLTSDETYGASKTINGGVFTVVGGEKVTDGIHHTYSADNAWISAGGSFGVSNPTGQTDCEQWIQFAFSGAFFITDIDIWNGCMTGPGAGSLRSFRETKIHYSVDGITWMQLMGPGVNGEFTFNPVPTFYSPYYFWYEPSDNIVMNRAAKYVVFSGYSNYGAGEYAMSELRFYCYKGNTQISLLPNPADSAIRVPSSTMLGWSPGSSAAAHEIYLGTSSNGVSNAVRLKGDLNGDGKVDFLDFSEFGAQWQLSPNGLTADLSGDGVVDLFDFSQTIAADWLDSGDGVYKGHYSLNTLMYRPPSLEAGRTYYWRVDEVNSSNTWKGNVWSFMVQGGAPAAAAYYVATNGSDDNDGLSLVTPFGTIQKARNVIVNSGGLPAGGVTVYIRGGKYFLNSQMDFTSANSGTVTSPIVYRAYTNESPRIIGGVQLDPSWFTLVPITDAIFNSRLPTSAKGWVYQCDLPAHGITNLGKLRNRGVSYGQTFHVGLVSHMELSCDGDMMQLARWPNSGYATITAGSTTGMTFTYSGTPANESKWPNASDPWVHGFWNYDFYDQYLPVATFTVNNNRVTLDDPPGNPSILAGKRWQVCNLLEELDQANEYYIETQVGNTYYGKLYFWPPANSVSGKEIVVSTVGENSTSLVKLSGASNLWFKGLTFEVSRFNAVEMQDCTSVVLDNCTIRNVGNIGVRVEGGSSCGVQNSKIYGLGQGIGLSGGNRYTLVGAGHYARNNEIHGFGRWIKAYQPAIGLYGVGNEASNNQIYNGADTGILCYQNNHLIQCNKIYNVAKETSDAGGIYSYWGWDTRGSLIKWNCIYDLIDSVPGGTGLWGIYLDGYTSGTTLYGNIIDNISPGSSGSAYTGGVLLNGGRDNEINGCIITYTPNAIVAGEWCAYPVNQAAAQRTRVSEFNYQSSPWSTTYPTLAAIPAAGDISNYAHPGGCKIINTVEKWNTTWTKTTLIGGLGDPFNAAYCSLTNNMLNTDPGYIDRTNKFFAPTYEGVARIPFERIGLLDQSQATNPIPRNDTTNVSKTTTVLHWAPAFDVNTHRVYFGTNPGSLPLVSPGQNYTSFVPTLSARTTYYWRIDQVNHSGMVVPGVEWHFTTGP